MHMSKRFILKIIYVLKFFLPHSFHSFSSLFLSLLLLLAFLYFSFNIFNNSVICNISTLSSWIITIVQHALHNTAVVNNIIKWFSHFFFLSLELKLKYIRYTYYGDTTDKIKKVLQSKHWSEPFLRIIFHLFRKHLKIWW